MTERQILVAIRRLYRQLDKVPPGAYTRASLGPPEIVAAIAALSRQQWALADPDTIGTLPLSMQGRRR